MKKNELLFKLKKEFIVSNKQAVSNSINNKNTGISNMSEFTTHNIPQDVDYLTWMKRRDERVAKMVANMKAKGIEQALMDLKLPEKEVEKTPTLYDFKNFDSKSFAAWAKTSSNPQENSGGRLRTF